MRGRGGVRSPPGGGDITYENEGGRRGPDYIWKCTTFGKWVTFLPPFPPFFHSPLFPFFFGLFFPTHLCIFLRIHKTKVYSNSDPKPLKNLSFTLLRSRKKNGAYEPTLGPDWSILGSLDPINQFIYNSPMCRSKCRTLHFHFQSRTKFMSLSIA